MKIVRPPKQPHEYAPGPLAIFRQGFWAYHHKGAFDPKLKYKTGSPLWNLYRKGYLWAKLNPTLVPDWSYGNYRAMRKALELAIKWSRQIDTGNSELMKNNLQALRTAWERCLLAEVWIPEWQGRSERVTTNPDGSPKTKPPGESGSGSKPPTTSRET